MKCRHFLLSVQALHAGYGGRTILKDVDIALASGEITALIGPNGSGKSTLLCCLCGEMLPLHGEILLEGLPLSRLSAKARARRIAVVPQRPEAPDIRASDMVLMGRYPHLPWHGFISSQDRRKTIAALRAAGASPLAERPVRTLSGVGAAAEKTLLSHGVRTLGAMGRADGALLRKIFGKNGEMMRDRALGRDRSEVAEDDEVKSVSNEVTYAHDLETREDIEAALSTIAAKVGRRLRRKGLKGRTVAVKMRYDNRTTRSAQCALVVPTDDDIAFAPVVHRLARELWAPGMKVRLLGVAVTHFEEDGAPVQETLFDAAALGGDDRADATQGAALIRDEKQRRSLLAATDALQERLGDGTVRFGFELRQSGNTTGSSSKNVEDYK